MAAKTSWHRYGTTLRHCHPGTRTVRRRYCIDTGEGAVVQTCGTRPQSARVRWFSIAESPIISLRLNQYDGVRISSRVLKNCLYSHRLGHIRAIWPRILLTCDPNSSRVEDTLGHTLTPAASGMCQFTRFIPAQSDVLQIPSDYTRLRLGYCDDCYQSSLI